MARTANFFKTAKTSNTSTKTSNSSMSQEDVASLIRKKAYELWEKRGRTTGHPLDDWLEAERIVRGRAK